MISPAVKRWAPRVGIAIGHVCLLFLALALAYAQRPGEAAVTIVAAEILR